MSATAYPPQLLEHCFVVRIGEGSTQLLGAFLEVSGLGVEYETYDYAEGGNNFFVHRLRGRRKHSNVTLKAGVTDRDVLLGWILPAGQKVPRPLPVQLSFTKPDGSALQTYGLANAVPVRWTGPNANIQSNAVATESLEIAHQGLRAL